MSSTDPTRRRPDLSQRAISRERRVRAVVLVALGLALLGTLPRLHSQVYVLPILAAVGCLLAAVATWRGSGTARDTAGVRLADDPHQCQGARRVRFTPARRAFTDDGRLRIGDPDGPGGTPRILDLVADVLAKSPDLTEPGAGLVWQDTAPRRGMPDWQAELDVPVDWDWLLEHAVLDATLTLRHVPAGAGGPERDVVLHQEWDGLVSYQDPNSPLWQALGWRPGRPWERPTPQEEARIRSGFTADAGRYDRRERRPRQGGRVSRR